ncbi:MAG TPA: peptidase [Pirellulales bacterium]|nr:peptidase [Pirellulales bacterium]
MFRAARPFYHVTLVWGACVAALLIGATAHADKLVMKDGRVYEGKLARLSSTGQQAVAAPSDGAPEALPIVLCDDNLRRIFVPKLQVQEAIASDLPASESFRIHQTVVRQGARATPIGPLLRVDPWDEFGRRTLQMNTAHGLVSILQGMTLITPDYTKVESIAWAKGKNHIWDMRIATSSIPSDALRKIVHKRIDPEKIESRLQLVRLLLQGVRYQDAQSELEQILADFPENKKQFEPTLRELRQRFARQALDEIKVRRTAGQHKLAMQLLEGFPAEGVAGETLQAVKQTLDEYRADFERLNEVVKTFDSQLQALDEDALQQRIKPIQKEIAEELNLHSLDRMAAYRQLRDDETLKTEDKLALAISGWLVGADDALRNLPVALSLVKVRDLVRQYLAEPSQAKRAALLKEISSQEGATPELVAKLLEYMLPPLGIEAARDEQPKDAPPNFYVLKVDGMPGEPAVRYYIQLPPEYDPHRRYPTILTLHGGRTTPALQIDWWAGSVGPGGMRLGQGTRHGYIVIAPAWAVEGQTAYHYSAAEHAAVWNTLRDACRRFSIDTDHVFLSGHSMGGDATWDIGLAHPDLWAGIMPIVARNDKYVPLLWENARRLPFYLVSGQLDGGNVDSRNAKQLDRYLTKPGFNATWVEYQGRCHENFSDEILRLFDWMGRYERDFFPKEFTCNSLRPWDNFFWWVELAEFSEKSMIEPEAFSNKGARPAKTKAAVNAANGLNVTTGAGKTIVWLSPKIVDFQQKISVKVNGKAARLPAEGVRPSLGVLLEDARTRADRLHPFWAKVEMPSGVVNDEE